MAWIPNIRTRLESLQRRSEYCDCSEYVTQAIAQRKSLTLYSCHEKTSPKAAVGIRSIHGEICSCKSSCQVVWLKPCRVVQHAAPVGAVNHTEGPRNMKDSGRRIDLMYLERKKKGIDVLDRMLGKAAQARGLTVLLGKYLRR